MKNNYIKLVISLLSVSCFTYATNNSVQIYVKGLIAGSGVVLSGKTILGSFDKEFSRKIDQSVINVVTKLEKEYNITSELAASQTKEFVKKYEKDIAGNIQAVCEQTQPVQQKKNNFNKVIAPRIIIAQQLSHKIAIKTKNNLQEGTVTINTFVTNNDPWANEKANAILNPNGGCFVS
jgi:hypothetical protein